MVGVPLTICIREVYGRGVDGIQSPVMDTETSLPPPPRPQPNTKSLRITVDTHTQVMRWAAHLNGTADDALRHLLGMSTVRVPISEGQRARWAEAAQESGMSLPEFIAMRVEAAVHYGGDPGTMGLILAHVQKQSERAGITISPADFVPPRRQP